MGPAVSTTTRMPAKTPSSYRRRRSRPGAKIRHGHAPPSGTREQLLDAAEALLRERGPEALSVRSVCARAGVPRERFAEFFAGPTDCMLAVFEQVLEGIRAAMRAAYRGEPCWLDGVRSALDVLLAALDQSTPLARFLIIDSALAEPPLRARREHAIAALAEALERERLGHAPPPQGESGARALVSAVVSVLHARLGEEPAPSLAELSGPLMGMIVLPYFGVGAARQELIRPAAPGRPTPALRLTPRTLATLRAIAAHPGAGNARIASAAGIADSGQASRLLARLRGLGLIDSEKAGRGRPVGKAWRLTDSGLVLLERHETPPGTAHPSR